MKTAWIAILESRKFWVALAAVASCVIVVLGADPQKWEPLIAAIVTLATVVIAATGYEDGQAKGSGQWAVGGGQGNGGGQPAVNPQSQIQNPPTQSSTVNALNSVKNPGVNLLLIGAMITLLLVSGCATDPSSRIAQARDGLTRAQDAILSQHAAGTITDQQLIALDPLVQGARESLNLAQDQVDHQQSGATLDYYLSVAESVLTKLEQFEGTVAKGPTPGH